MKAKIILVLEFLSQIVFTIVLTIFMSIFFLISFNYQWDKELYSFAYSIIIFMIGIHIALKIRILDSKEEYSPIIKKFYFGKNIFLKNEFIAFILSIIINVVFLIAITGWIAINSGNESLSTSINVVICLNFAIICRNLYVFIRLYWKNAFPLKQVCDTNIENNKSIDLFKEWLDKKENNNLVNIALTDKSYKNKYLHENSSTYTGETNKDLATYGDAIIKICYIEILYGNVDKISVEKSKYESDKYLVEKVAEHYKLLDYMNYDDKDPLIVSDYNYIDPPKTSGGHRKPSPHKYIATAVEAMIGAIYKETKNMNAIIELLDNWRKLS